MAKPCVGKLGLNRRKGKSSEPKPKGPKLLDPKKLFLEVIREKLYETVAKGDVRLVEQAAEAFIDQMCKGSFAHAKEILDREQGKVPTRLANADGENVKYYVGIPTDGEEAP